MAPIAPPTLSDGTITLRPPAESDVPAIVRACQDPEIPRWTRLPSPYTVEDARRFLAVAATEAAAGAGVALVIVDDPAALLGAVGLTGLDRQPGGGEIGYWLAREARGRGAATRAVRLMCAWAARELAVESLELFTYPDSAPSAAVAQRAGFAPTGEVRRIAGVPPERGDGFLVHVWHP
jgi:RimJ/RimL family protein N-acetyltransferase